MKNVKGFNKIAKKLNEKGVAFIQVSKYRIEYVEKYLTITTNDSISVYKVKSFNANGLEMTYLCKTQQEVLNLLCI